MQLQVILSFCVALAVVSGTFAQEGDDKAVNLPVVYGKAPSATPDRSVYSRAAASVTNVTSDIYTVIVGPVEMVSICFLH